MLEISDGSFERSGDDQIVIINKTVIENTIKYSKIFLYYNKSHKLSPL